jgi:1-acyl-sn-glycerol-3-phosphate acyltransferase
MNTVIGLLFRDPAIVLSTIVCASAGAVVSLLDREGNRQIAIARFWARTLLWAAGIRDRVAGREKLDRAQPYVFASNHLSYMDTPVILANVPSQFRFMAKAELFRIPFLGNHLKLAGHIPVPREDPRAALKTLSAAAQSITQRRISLLVFPEGGRSPSGVLQPFKEGAAYIAIKAQVPLVPVAIRGTREVLPVHGRIPRPGPVTLAIGDPIPTAGLTLKDRERLTAEVRERIAALLGA